MFERINRNHLAFVHDLFMAAASFVLALVLRLGPERMDLVEPFLLTGTLGFTAVCAVVFLSMGLYRGIWRYASLSDLMQIAKAVTLAILIQAVALFLITRLEGFPRSALAINWLLLMFLLGGPRMIYRMVKDSRIAAGRRRDGMSLVRVLVIGADDEAEAFIRETKRSADSPYEAVGLVSVGPSRVGRVLHGLKVAGTFDEVEQVIDDLHRRERGPQRLVLTGRALKDARVDALLELADRRGLALARLPRLTDLKAGLADPLQIRPIAIEDLLGRPQTRLDRSKISAFLHNRRVMITGAGGSIGSELVRQIAAYGPSRLILLDAGEYNLYRIDLELAERFPAVARATLLGDVRDPARLDQIMSAEQPEVVFHAAAFKHVPLVELNPNEGLLTNVIGTRLVADACRRHQVATMVLISTDKAVNPANVMGASKRLAECYCQALDHAAGGRPGATRFVTVRFGNVLGSTGSVVPLFRRQLEAGGPLTVTHPEVTRYFMTIPEAVELVLQAAELGTHGDNEGGKIFVLDMGRPVRIIDLARHMIRLAGLKPDEDVEIRITGLRPGEKLYEELFHDGEPPVTTERDGVHLAAPRIVNLALLERTLAELEHAARARDTDRALSLVATLVPEFRPPETEPAPRRHAASPT